MVRDSALLLIELLPASRIPSSDLMMKPDAAGGLCVSRGLGVMLSDSICASCTGTRRAAFRKHSRNLCHTGDLFLQTVDCQVVGHCACPTPNGQCVIRRATGFGTGGVFFCTDDCRTRSPGKTQHHWFSQQSVAAGVRGCGVSTPMTNHHQCRGHHTLHPSRAKCEVNGVFLSMFFHISGDSITPPKSAE